MKARTDNITIDSTEKYDQIRNDPNYAVWNLVGYITTAELINKAINDGYDIDRAMCIQAEKGRNDMVRELLNRGANVFSYCGFNGAPLIEIAKNKCNFELLQICKDFGSYDEHSIRMLEFVEEKNKLAEENAKLKKDAELYRSFYEHYHGYGELFGNETEV